MGIVYKAQDTKLDRVVAVKVLPASALSSRDDLARFYREAKSAARLHHPHIAAVFEIDRAVPEDAPPDEPRPFIAMEFIDGQSLHDVLEAGPMKLEEAVRIAIQIAQALQAAHENDVIHRDIKAANVMMTAKRDAKVLDFGLAKTTQSTMLTKMDSTLGTAAYMSPEQTRGDSVDRRTDLWSLGVLLYEMVAGRLPFRGDYEQAITYSILNEEPEPLTAVRTGVPMRLEWIVTKLLAKSADDRFQNASDLIVDLRTVDLQASGLSRVSTTAHLAGKPIQSSRILPAAAGAMVGVLVVALMWMFRSGAGTGHNIAGSPKRFVQSVPAANGVGAAAISRKGDKVALARNGVQILDLETRNIRRYSVPGAVAHIDFSKDGTELLLTKSDGIDRMSLASGSVVNVVNPDEAGPRAVWRNDDLIVFEEKKTIFGMSLTTSEIRQIITLDSLEGEYDIDFPYVLPDGNTLMATAEFREEPSRIGFWDLDTGRSLAYLPYPGYRAQWVSEGYLVFSMDGNAVALPFDLNTLEQTGPIIPIAERVPPQGLSVSEEGTLVHVDLEFGLSGSNRSVFPVVYRQVETSGSYVSRPGVFPSAAYTNGAVSPDGEAAAVAIHTFDTSNDTWKSDIWVLDFATGTRRALTRDGTSDYPAWSPRGDSIYFIRDNINDEIMVMAASGRGGARLVAIPGVPIMADLTVSPNGEWAIVATSVQDVDSQSRIRLLNLRTTESVTIETATGSPRQFDFSPSGKYLAFEDEGGIFVLPMDDLSGTPYLIWESGMTRPRWSADESRLFAWSISLSITLFVEVRTDPVFATVSVPEELIPLYRDAFLTASLFDVFPNVDQSQFLWSTADLTSPDNTSSDSVDRLVDVHFIVNLPSLLAE